MAVAGVIAIHLLLYVWLRDSSGWRLQPAAVVKPALVTLRLLAPPIPKPAETPATRAWHPRQRPEAFPPTSAPTSAPTTPPTSRARMESPSAPVDPATGPQRFEAGAVASAPASAASQPPALDLRLPPNQARSGATRNPALDDPRANGTRTTPEQRMAASLDTRVTEEVLGDGRRRIRRGDQCVIVQPSRVGQLMPFNEAAARSPSLVGACP